MIRADAEYPESGYRAAAGHGVHPGSKRGRRLKAMRRKLATAVVVAGLAICGGAGSVSAHHAFAAEVDANKPVRFKGSITKMKWVNPTHGRQGDRMKPARTRKTRAVEW